MGTGDFTAGHMVDQRGWLNTIRCSLVIAWLEINVPSDISGTVESDLLQRPPS